MRIVKIDGFQIYTVMDDKELLITVNKYDDIVSITTSDGKTKERDEINIKYLAILDEELKDALRDYRYNN